MTREDRKAIKAAAYWQARKDGYTPAEARRYARIAGAIARRGRYGRD